MPAMNLVILGLSVLATFHLTSGQWGGGTGWGTGSNSWGGGGSRWGSQSQRSTEADRAICTAEADPEGDGNPITLEITVKRSSSGWWGSSSLELEYSAETDDADDQREYELVFTEFGGDDNEGGCTVENLGNIVKGQQRNRGSSWSWGWGSSSSSDGVIGTVDLTGDGRDSGTFRNLPARRLAEVWGCGVALCTDTEDAEEEEEEEMWNWGWGGGHWGNSWGSRRNDKMRCVEPIPICCHLGKSEDDADRGE